MIESQQRVIFLDKIHLFNGLKEEQLASIGQRLTEREVSSGNIIFKRGDKPDGFYMVYKGKVKVTRPREKGEDFLAWLVAGDYFGEEALFENRNRSATVTVMEDSTLLFLSRKDFEKLLTQYANLKPNFKVTIKSRKLARSLKFKWLGKNEVIYFIARRHKLRLYQALVAPVLTLLIPISLFAWSAFTGATTPYAVGILILIGLLGWGVWNAVDWSNDYYIVTNQRVIWVEKVIGLYDSRQEAPLGNILSVNIETDMVGRALDYGNVIVRTFVGRLEFDSVDHPVQAADMIREYWERAKVVTTQSQKDVMKKTIRQKLGLPVEKTPQLELAPLVPVDEEKIAQTPFWVLALSNFFKLRLEEGATVIYRKHWIIFLQQAWIPILLFIGTAILLASRIAVVIQSPELIVFHRNSAGTLKPDTITVAIPLLMTPILCWLWYEYTDWKNDVFMVTPDEIYDIDRKPFGKEERRAAQIENILSTSYKRDGFIAYAFNYGTVHISVGGNQLMFEDVMDPASVQSDINRRRMTRMAKKSEDAGRADRERFATWIAAYHENLDNINASMATKISAGFPTSEQATIHNKDGPPVEDMDDDLDDDLDDDDSDAEQEHKSKDDEWK